MANATRFWLGLQLVVGVVVLLAAWGFAALLIVGYVLNPAQLGRSMDDGAPLWPWLVGFLMVLVTIGAGGLLAARGAARRANAVHSTEPQPAPTPFPSPHVSDDAMSPTVDVPPVELRTKLFLLALLLLGTAAILAGMISEWAGEVPQGFAGPGTLLAVATLAGSSALGIAFSRRMSAARAARAADPAHIERDTRPTTALLRWHRRRRGRRAPSHGLPHGCS